jgi:hypothetical protein
MDTISVVRKYRGLNSYFLDSLPAVGTPDREYPNAYFLYHSDPDVDGDICTYERTYHSTPVVRGKNTTSGYLEETYVWTIPGIDDSLGFRIKYDVSSVSYATTTVTLNCSATVTDIDPNDYITVEYKSTNPSTGNSYYSQYNTIASAVVGAAVTCGKSNDTGVITYLTVRRSDLARKPFQETVCSYVQKEYFNVGKDVKSIDDVPRSLAWRVYDASGYITDTVTANSSPNLTQYRALIDAGTLIVAEATVIKPWKGPILEATTRFVRAQ